MAMVDLKQEKITGIYISSPLPIYNNNLFVLFEFADCFLFFDGMFFSIIQNKGSTVLDEYQKVGYDGLADGLSITKLFVLESWWCYVIFSNGEALHVYQTYDGINWWEEYELILKNDSTSYYEFIDRINDDSGDEIDMAGLKSYNSIIDFIGQTEN
jgi:hypothetical protein